MSLKDLLKLVDDKLEDVFKRKSHDPSRARQKMLKHIDRTHEQFHATESQRGRKPFSVKNNVVKYSSPVPINGKSTHFMPSERFPDFLKHLRGATEGGELDQHLETSAAKKPAQRSRNSGTGRGWTAERRAAYEATISAKKKKK